MNHNAIWECPSTASHAKIFTKDDDVELGVQSFALADIRPSHDSGTTSERLVKDSWSHQIYSSQHQST